MGGDFFFSSEFSLGGLAGFPLARGGGVDLVYLFQKKIQYASLKSKVDR